MSGKMCSSNSVIQVQKLVDQLRVEAGMERIKVCEWSVDCMQAVASPDKLLDMTSAVWKWAYILKYFVLKLFISLLLTSNFNVFTWLHHCYSVHFCPKQISLTAADLVRYCQEHRRHDPLLTGIAASSNPFKDKKSCVLLWQYGVEPRTPTPARVQPDSLLSNVY